LLADSLELSSSDLLKSLLKLSENDCSHDFVQTIIVAFKLFVSNPGWNNCKFHCVPILLYQKPYRFIEIDSKNEILLSVSSVSIKMMLLFQFVKCFNGFQI
jgi:hypothetical protein